MEPWPLSSPCTAWAGPGSGKRITWRLAPLLTHMCRSCLAGIVPLQHGEMLRGTLPHAKLKVIDRCGHVPMVEKPETFHRLLYDFLLGVEEEIPDVVKI